MYTVQYILCLTVRPKDTQIVFISKQLQGSEHISISTMLYKDLLNAFLHNAFFHEPINL